MEPLSSAVPMDVPHNADYTGMNDGLEHGFNDHPSLEYNPSDEEVDGQLAHIEVCETMLFMCCG
jgi:hypothetical protein